MNTIEKDKAYIANTYNRYPIEIVCGKGSIVWDADGKRYIDMGSGIAVTSFGVSDDIWQEAVKEQIALVQHMSNLYYTAPCAELARLLCEKTGMKKVFFGNSGAEANECAIKAARKWASENKGSEYSTILTLENSFHGRTLTTLAATGQAHYHELYQPLTPGFAHVKAGDIAGLEQAVSEHKIAALMIECVQGEGGVRPIGMEYAQQAEKICRENGILLIVDEVQTGNGRSGNMYAYMNYGLHPDIVSTAKGLAGGLPLGACLLNDKVQDVFSFGDHGSTFGGNPVCCAAAISIVKRLDEDMFADVRRKSEYVFSVLEDAEGIESVSGMGLMIGIKTVRPCGEIVKKCMENGVLCLTAKDRVRLLPALNIPFDVLKEAVSVIKKVCAEEVV